MKIAYIAKHSRGLENNDDEGAIAFALTSLGHQVVKIEEKDSYDPANACDFVLFHHHCGGLDRIGDIQRPKVFWFFDLIDHPLMPGRNVAYLERMRAVSNLGFCTDGEWAGKYPNLYQLCQGADVRIAGRKKAEEIYPITFAGAVWYLQARKKQLLQLQGTYGTRLKTLTAFTSWVYRDAFAELVSQSQIVLSLQQPTKPDYWSNRVYLVSGFGGMVLHPYCKGLSEQYIDGEEIAFYRAPGELFSKIDWYLGHPEARERIREGALRRTLAEHTYTHRCSSLISTIREWV